MFSCRDSLCRLGSHQITVCKNDIAKKTKELMGMDTGSEKEETAAMKKKLSKIL